MRSVLLLVKLFALVLLLFADSMAQTTSTKTTRTRFRSPFRYVIVADKFTPKLDDKDEDSRGIVVLLDPKAFSKDNLVKVFRLTANRYPQPSLLFVQLFTSLDDIDTPEEHDSGNFTETDSKRPQNDRAVFVRANNRSFFYIYRANGDHDEVEMK